MLRSLCIAFATYSRIPTPRTEWDEGALRYAICFFPLIGAVIGALEYGWLLLSELLCCGDLLRGAVAAVNALVFLWYRVMSMRQFGGVTGDLAGCFVTVAELGTALVLALTAGL